MNEIRPACSARVSSGPASAGPSGDAPDAAHGDTSGGKAGDPAGHASGPAPGHAPADPVARTVVICNQRGLHARASARFVKLAGTFDAEVTVTRDDQTVAGTSIMGLLVLGAAPGCKIDISATGPQAAAALDALCELVESRFGED